MKKFLFPFLVFAITALFLSNEVWAQGRNLWKGHANVTGTFTANRLSATETVTADYMIFGASETPIKIDTTPASGQGLIYSSTEGAYIPGVPLAAAVVYEASDILDVSAANLLPGDALIRMATWWESLQMATSLLQDVSQTTKSDGWVLGWNAADLVWEATPTSGGALSSIDEIGDVSTETKSDGQVLSWSAGESIWRATAPATGGGSGATTLEGLTDTAIVGPASGEYLQHDGSTWFNHAFTQSLDDLSDVEMGAPSNNDVLTYDSVIARWKAAAGGSGSGDIPEVIVARDTSPYVAIADFVCSGTNDQVQIQQAVNSINSASGIITVLAGSYTFSSFVNIATPGITIRGQGMENTIFKRGYITPSADKGLVHVALGGNHTSLLDFSIDGLSVAGSYNYGISENSSDDILIERVSIKRSGGGITLSGTAGPLGVKITKCVFSYLSVNDPAISISTKYYTHISECLFTNNLNIGIAMSTNSKYTTVDSCYFINGTYAISGSNSGYNKISNCTMIGCTSGGIVSNGVHTTISNCYVVGTGGDQAYRVGASYQFIYGCVSKGSEIGVYIDGEHIEINDCKFYDSTTTNGTITIQSGSNYITIHNSLIYNGTNVQAVYYSNTDYLIVENNQFITNTGKYLFLGATSDHTIIKNNLFQGGYKGGISLSTSNDCIISGNEFYNNSSDASSPELDITSCKRLLIENNYFLGTRAVTCINIDDGASIQSTILLKSNTFGGSYTADYVLEAGQTIHPERWMELTDQSTGYAGAMIGSASASACIGFATSDPSTIKHVITVSQNATTNPIATAWDVWSLPSLKEDIALIGEDKEDLAVSQINRLKLIDFDWKYSEGPIEKPLIKEGEDSSIIDKEYDAYLKEYDLRKAIWNAEKNRTKSWSVDIEDENFPDEFASFDNRGKKVGVNLTAVLWRTVSTLQKANRLIESLETRILKLEGTN